MSRRSISDLTEQLREISRELELLTFDQTADALSEREERRDELEEKARLTWGELENAVVSLRRQPYH